MKLISLTVCVLVLLSGPSQGQVTDASQAKLTPKHPSRFDFNGGQLHAFVSEIKSAFGVDLQAIGTVPDQMLYEVHVPKMRIGGEGQKLDFRNVLYLYNSVSEKGDPSLGRWVIEGPINMEPQLIMLVPSGRRSEGGMLVRAFALPAPNEKRGEEIYKILLETLEVQRREISDLIQIGRYPGMTTAEVQGNLRYHKEAGIVVATGGRLYVELALAIHDAMREKGQQVDIVIPDPEEKKEPK